MLLSVLLTVSVVIAYCAKCTQATLQGFDTAFEAESEVVRSCLHTLAGQFCMDHCTQ